MTADQLALFGTGDLPVQIVRRGDRLVIPEGVRTADCTHTLHRFPGKFIPSIPRLLYRTALSTRRERVVLDPFCGSGTSLLEAALDGRPYVGVDIDPLAVLVARAKTEALDAEEIHAFQAFWHRHDYRVHRSDVVPAVPRLGHWFSEQAALELSSIKGRCFELDGKLQRLSLVVFSSIIRQVSNADDQTQKTYVSHTLHKNPPLPSTVFPTAVRRAVHGLKQYGRLLPSEPIGTVSVGDARSLSGAIEFDDVLTSPPYIDSIDYPYNQMLEYFWLLPELDVGSYDEYRRLRKLPMGFSAVDDSAWHQFVRMHPDPGNAIQDVIDHVAHLSQKEASNVRGFFVDMARHLTDMRGRQTIGAYYICVIGNSTIRGIQVSTVELLRRLFENSGYSLTDRSAYEIRRHYMKFPRRENSGKIKEDHVLVFQAA